MDTDALLKQLRERVAGLSTASRVALIAALAALGLVATLMSNGESLAADAYLFTSLEPSDAGEIVAKLKEQRIPYTLAAGGAAIMVPQARVHELRLELAQSGLPKGGGIGFELLDRPSYGQSDFVQQKNYARALQGELERTIGSMSTIQKARVHLVLPERRLFRDGGDHPSASIVVRLRPGRSLGEAQASGIIHLVAASVAGLSPEHVTLVDDAGTALASRSSGDGPAADGLDYKRSLEKALEQKIRGMLDRALGAGQSSVQVSAELDFSQIERTEELYDPDRTALRSEQAVDERQNRTTTATLGVAGARSNLVGAADAKPAASEASSQPTGAVSQKSATTRNYEVNKVVSRTVMAPARLVHLNAAVLVDGAYSGEKRTFAPLPAEQLEALEAVVKRAMGFDEKRGDQLALRCVPFFAAPVEETPKTPMYEIVGEGARRFAVPVAAVLVVMLAFFALLAALRGRRTNSARPELLAAGPRPLRELEAITAQRTSADDPSAGGATQIQQAVLGDGASAANVVRGWLSDGKQKEGAR